MLTPDQPIPLDSYEEYIVKLIQKQSSQDYEKKYVAPVLRKELELQKYHILPKHSAGTDDQNNLVICTREDHITAHKIRFNCYKNYNDQAAYLFMQSQTKEANAARGKGIADKHRQNGTGFFDPTFQKEMGKRSKKLYHLAENPNLTKKYSALSKGVPKKTSEVAKANYLARGKFVGTHFGSKGGRAHQDSVTKERLRQKLVWVHLSGVKVKTNNVETLKKVQDLLNEKVNRSVKFTSGLSDIIRKKEKQRYGWSLED